MASFYISTHCQPSVTYIKLSMADSLVLQLTDKGLVTDSLTLDVGYDRENCDSGKYRGPVHIDHYGRTVPKGAHGSTKLDNPTNLGSILISATTELFESIADKTLTVRRITIAAKPSSTISSHPASDSTH